MEKEEGNSTTQSPPPIENEVVSTESTVVNTPEIKEPKIEEPQLNDNTEVETVPDAAKREEPIDLDKIEPPSSLNISSSTSSSSPTKTKKRKRSSKGSKSSSKKMSIEKKVTKHGSTLKKMQTELRALSRTVKAMKNKMPTCR